jgi:hypothetical protein
MSDTAKFTKMHDYLDKPLGSLITTIDQEGPFGSPALFAGLCTAKVLLAHAQYDEMGGEREDAWKLFRTHLQRTVTAMTAQPDAGQVSQWGMWDGLHAAAVKAGQIDSEEVAKDGTPVQEAPAPDAG